jgi:ABC-type transport system involved in multi-copper enzyme maturation permease subunit
VFFHTAKHPFATRRDLRSALTTAVVPLVFAGYALGASILGSDYTSRALTTLLTWEPRRRLVLASRVAASALVTAGITALLLLILIVVLLPASIAHGIGGGLDTAWYLSTVGLLLRCVALTALASLIGVCAAALGRSTAAAMIAIVVYLVLIEDAALSTAPSVGRWLLIFDSVSWLGEGSHRAGGGPAGHTILTGGLLLAAAAIYATTAATIERRDIT